jgi:hypothetical protein
MKESDLIWDTVELLIPGAQFTVWSRNGGKPFPNLEDHAENEPEFDDLCPEENVTKHFWKTLYHNSHLA